MQRDSHWPDRSSKHPHKQHPDLLGVGRVPATCQHQGSHTTDGMTNSPHFFQYTNLNNTKNQHLITCDFY